MLKTHARGVKRRDEILTFIRTYQEDEGVTPSIRNIASSLGYKTTSVVHHHLQVLEQEGMIRRHPGMARSIQLIKQ